MADLAPGAIRVRDLSRNYRLIKDRSLTLKETILRRRRTVASTVEAVKGVSLDVAPGEAVGIIGKNGSGKSTLLKVLAGIIKPHSGEVKIAGSVASMLELGAGFHPDYSGRENVYLNGSIFGLSRTDVEERFDEIVDFAEIHDFIDAPVRTYSSGMFMRLAFSIASHVNPDVLLLDEVLAVGDEAFQMKCMGRIFEYQQNGGTLVFVSHDPGAVERICDRAILLDKGQISMEGATEEVLGFYHRELVGDTRASGAVGSTVAQDDNRIWGTQEAYISACRLIGARGEVNRFTNGEPLTIEMDVIPTRPLESPVYGVSISTSDGLLCFGTNTRLDARRTEMLREPTTVRFTIPSLPLQEGSFVAQFAVHSQDESVVYHWLDRWIQFSVFHTSPGIGIVNMQGSWQFAPAADVKAHEALKPVADNAS